MMGRGITIRLAAMEEQRQRWDSPSPQRASSDTCTDTGNGGLVNLGKHGKLKAGRPDPTDKRTLKSVHLASLRKEDLTTQICIPTWQSSSGAKQRLLPLARPLLPSLPLSPTVLCPVDFPHSCYLSSSYRYLGLQPLTEKTK